MEDARRLFSIHVVVVCLVWLPILPQRAAGDPLRTGTPVGSQKVIGDADSDGDVDLADFALFECCFASVGLCSSPGCEAADPSVLDTDGSGQIDEPDLAMFAACLSGPDTPVPTGCIVLTFSVAIAGASTLEDGHSTALTASVSGETGTVVYDWAVVAGHAVVAPPDVPDPGIWMTGAEDVVVQVTATDLDAGGAVVASAVAQHTITAVQHSPFTYEVFAGDDRTLSASTINSIDLVGAYFDPAGCGQPSIYWEWDMIAGPIVEGGWFDQRHRLGTPAEPVRWYPLGAWTPGDYVFSLYGYNSCTRVDDQDTLVVALRMECLWDLECDDGLFCNGAEYCDEEGFCQAGAPPCATLESCNETTDTCGCTTDADCDDDLFCNGAETCVADACSNGVAPCDESDVCEEDTRTCVPNVATAFTVNQDDLTGSAGDDVFTAPLGTTGLGFQASTLQTGDAANGLAGADTLNADLIAAGGTSIVPTLASIETVNIRDFSADDGGGAANTTIFGTTITGMTTFNNVDSTHGALADKDEDLVVANLPTLANLGIVNTTQDTDIQFAAAATTGASDSMTLRLSNSNTGTAASRATVTITTGAVNGIESLTINSVGSANRILDLVQATGATLATLNITGDKDLQIGNFLTAAGALNNSILTVNAGAFTGNITELTVGNGNVAFTGGTGNDTVIYGVNYTTADTINGGAGTADYLGLTAAFAAPASAQTNVTNIEGLRILDTLNVALTLTAPRWGTGVVNVILDEGSTGGTITSPAGTGNTVSIGSFGQIVGPAGIASTTLGVTVGGIGDTADVLALTLNDAQQTGAVTITGAETVNLASNVNLSGAAAAANGFGAAFAMAPTSGTGTVAITGTAPLTFTGATTAGTINAGSFTQVLTMTAASVIATAITGGSANDILRGAANLQDTIVGGAGDDKIVGGGGALTTTNDFLTGGLGADIFCYRVVAGADEFTIISDFIAGTDKIGIGTPMLNFAGVAGTLAVPAALTAADFQTRADETVIVVGDTLKVVVLSSSRTTVQITTGLAAGVADAVVVAFNSTTNVAEVYYDNDWTDAALRVRLATLSNITTLAGTTAIAAGDFVEID